MPHVESKVVAIQIAPDKAYPMEQVDRVFALRGAGLDGDRYAENRGAWSKSKRRIPRHVTLISREAINEANAEFGTDFTIMDTRRNIVTTGVDLNTLVGHEFYVARVRMRGVELADPCGRPSKLSGKEGFKEVFDGRGGLRVEVLSSGSIRKGSPVSIFES